MKDTKKEMKEVIDKNWRTGFYSGVIYTMTIVFVVEFIFWLLIL